MAELIAAGTTETSAEFTVTAGTPVTVFLKYATSTRIPTGAGGLLQIKDAGGNFVTVPDGVLGRYKPQMELWAPGTYKFTRYASSYSIGVDKA